MDQAPLAKDDVRAKAEPLRREGKSYSEIQETTGVSQASLSLWLRDVQLTPEQEEALPERTAHALRRAGMTARRRADERHRRLIQAASAENPRADPT